MNEELNDNVDSSEPSIRREIADEEIKFHGQSCFELSDGARRC